MLASHHTRYHWSKQVPNTIGKASWRSRIDYKFNFHWPLVYLDAIVLLRSRGGVGSTVKFNGSDTTRLSIWSVGDDASPDGADNLGEIFLESRESLMLEVRFLKNIDLKFRRRPNCCKGEESRHKATETRERKKSKHCCWRVFAKARYPCRAQLGKRKKSDGCVAPDKQNVQAVLPQLQASRLIENSPSTLIQPLLM